MRQSTQSVWQLWDLSDADLAADELERMTRVGALLRTVADLDREEAARSSSADANRPSLRVIPTRPPPTASKEATNKDETYELSLTFSQLVLVSKSLQAVKTLGHLPPQDELLDDTIHLVTLALTRAV